LRVREIFRYPKRDNLPVTPHRGRAPSQSAGGGANELFGSSQIFTFTASAFLRHVGDWMAVPLEPTTAVRQSLVRLARVAPS
jgi:hypothetical protein